MRSKQQHISKIKEKEGKGSLTYAKEGGRPPFCFHVEDPISRCYQGREENEEMWGCSFQWKPHFSHLILASAWDLQWGRKKERNLWYVLFRACGQSTVWHLKLKVSFQKYMKWSKAANVTVVNDNIVFFPAQEVQVTVHKLNGQKALVIL